MADLAKHWTKRLRSIPAIGVIIFVGTAAATILHTPAALVEDYHKILKAMGYDAKDRVEVRRQQANAYFLGKTVHNIMGNWQNDRGYKAAEENDYKTQGYHILRGVRQGLDFERKSLQSDFANYAAALKLTIQLENIDLRPWGEFPLGVTAIHNFLKVNAPSEVASAFEVGFLLEKASDASFDFIDNKDDKSKERRVRELFSVINERKLKLATSELQFPEGYNDTPMGVRYVAAVVLNFQSGLEKALAGDAVNN